MNELETEKFMRDKRETYLNSILDRIAKLEKQIICCPHVEDAAMRERADAIRLSLTIAAELAKPPPGAPREFVRLFLIGGEGVRDLESFGEDRLRLQLEKGSWVDWLVADFEELLEEDSTFAEAVEMGHIHTRPCTPDECAALEKQMATVMHTRSTYLSTTTGGVR